MESGKAPQWQVVLAGDAFVGKSSLAARLGGGRTTDFQEPRRTTASFPGIAPLLAVLLPSATKRGQWLAVDGR